MNGLDPFGEAGPIFETIAAGEGELGVGGIEWSGEQLVVGEIFGEPANVIAEELREMMAEGLDGIGIVGAPGLQELVGLLLVCGEV